jgi:hypothetical protein
MPRPRRQTNIQLLNRAFDNIVKVSSHEQKNETNDIVEGSGASRVVKPKKKIDKQKKKDDQPINTRILLTR